jgi:aminopeptidase N
MTLRADAPVFSWEDVRALFENEIRQDLGWFFGQWVDRKGLPDLRVENASVRRSKSRFEVSFDLVQKGEIYMLDVPVSTTFVQGGSRTDRIRLDTEQKHVVLYVDEEPANIAIDREYDIPRKLTEAEMPPLLSRLLGDERPVMVPPAVDPERYAAVRDAWRQRGAEERKAEDLKDAEIRSSSLILFGEDNPLISRLYGKAGATESALSLTARKNPWDPDKVVVIVQAGSAKAAAESLPMIVEFGQCSSLSMDAHGLKKQRTGATGRGIMMELRTEPAAIEVSALKTLTDVIEKASGKRIVYVGEYHDRFAHHNVQLQVIKTLYRKDPKIAVGMEMFQRPYQKVLDDYISGAIDEHEFLKKSEYFKRWNFDYNLYKPILDFARAEKIPVVALNLRGEITEKVSKSGMDSLTDEEKKELPEQMDLSDIEYRERLRQAFDQHKSKGERDFDNFLQAQILWDESMAQSIDEYLQKNPDRRMVVVAGLGHLLYGSGIPKRVVRRNEYTYTTVLNDADVERDIGEYIVFPQPLEGLTAPKIMAVLKETGGMVRIIDLPEGSVSKMAGIKVGDTLISFDGVPMQSVNDIKIALFYKKHEETLKVKVVRKRFLLGDKEMEFDVQLQ